MTHLGLVSAAAVAARGFRTICYDPDASLIGRLQQGDLHVAEPDLPDLLASNSDRQSFTADIAGLHACDIVYISVDVPTDDTGGSDLTPIRSLIGDVCAHMHETALLVVLCQVPPGFCRGLSDIPHDRLIYQVETLVFGRAVERATQPERYVVGVANPDRPLPPHYAALLDTFDCPILTMRYESAELAKISINFCLVASVSVANTLSEISEAIGADWYEIVPALKLDKRIGPHAYLTPGLGISGGNLERDLRTVLTIGGDRGTDIGIIEAWLANSHYRKDWLWRTLQDAVLSANEDALVAVLGLAYKEHTHSTKNSPSLRLLSYLERRRVRVHDPVVPSMVVPFAEGCESPLECARGADALVLATPWPEYRELSLRQLYEAMRGRVIIDPYRLLDGRRAKDLGFAYHTLGVAPLTPN